MCLLQFWCKSNSEILIFGDDDSIIVDNIIRKINRLVYIVETIY